MLIMYFLKIIVEKFAIKTPGLLPLSQQQCKRALRVHNVR